MKRALFMLLVLTAITSIFSGAASATTPNTNDITEHFSYILKRNAIIVDYAVEEDKKLGTYPKGVGRFIAEKQQSNLGDWYYGNKLNGGTDGFIFNGQKLTKLELSNIHYGYIGRAAGFSKAQLLTLEGANQISSLPKNWAEKYFNNLGLKGKYWISYGANIWDNKTLSYPTLSSSFAVNSFNSFETPVTVPTLTNEEKQKIHQEMMRISQKIKGI
ncbi:hypothetical protein bmyco0003_56510 [Bacillus pseudomycoides]|uniref:polymorphic toxin type 44 domain-containing protein n=1 Tax=Bacillus pseudomycoides TaxID=64104 RepID=UPI0001A14FAB|nr:polymorphic toxin type 44 domain-containing protein [Bacillus pseudomycoides]EEM07683.1 hypothetical protein bmyco0003_56510 [Bacillus pseudomycoides]PEJ23250.1 hypothetical protein CN887_21330 [Bacillus pseudomycoides]